VRSSPAACIASKLCAVPERSEPGSASGEEPRGDGVGEALRTAVERTLAATVGSAAGTRQRAGELFDEVARRGVAASQEVARRGEAAREQVGRRGEAAREEVGRRGEAARAELLRRGEEAAGQLADAITELRHLDRVDTGALSERIRELEGRLGALERLLRRDRGPAESQAEGEDAPLEAGEEADPGA
jgi:polyhydroxyalkanoate synthesis regulator phasin